MKKERASVDTVFDCPFCNHKQTVECKMNYTTNLGNIKCRVCAVSFQSDIHRTTDTAHSPAPSGAEPRHSSTEGVLHAEYLRDSSGATCD